ncbi:pyridoxal 5'-phosphate synthase glutaminase subunit PdxT [Oceanithermus sp.]
MSDAKHVGVLALQGDFREHKLMLERLGARVREVRLPEHLESLGGLVVPGGESTTIGKLAAEYGLDAAVRQAYEAGDLAIWGTCAGAIWIAREILDYQQPHLGLMDIAVRRNAFGRQVDSFEVDLEVEGLNAPFRAVFIRAPEIVRAGEGVRVRARHEGRVVFAEQERMWAMAFHPELTGDDRLHREFLARLVAS